MMQQACISTNLQQGNVITSIIGLHGSLSDLPEEYLIETYIQANPVTNGTIIINCSELEAMNSRVISQMIQLLICTRRQQQRLLIFGLSEHDRYILEITRLNQFIDIVETETQAVAALHLS
jgi:anti-anti-sigma regulatory factor